MTKYDPPQYDVFPPRESLVSDIPAGDRNIEKLFLLCTLNADQKSFGCAWDPWPRLCSRGHQMKEADQEQQQQPPSSHAFHSHQPRCWRPEPRIVTTVDIAKLFALFSSAMTLHCVLYNVYFILAMWAFLKWYVTIVKLWLSTSQRYSSQCTIASTSWFCLQVWTLQHSGEFMSYWSGTLQT